MKKFMMVTLIAVFSVAVMCAGGVKKAEALSLRFGGDGLVTTTINDIDADGAIAHIFSNTTWTIGFASAATKDAFGTANNPSLHLTVTATTRGANSLWVMMSDSGYTNASTRFSHSLNGFVSNGTASSDAYFDTSNALWGGTLFSSLTTMPSSGSGGPAGSQPYSLTLTGTMSFGSGGGSGSLDNFILTPEPGTIALLGIGLAGLVGVGVRRRMKMKKNVD